MRPIRRKQNERGVAMMEFALLLPFLVLIVMLVVEGSRMIRTHQVLNNAAREGARLSILPENKGNKADIVTEVVNYANLNGVTISSTDVTINQAATINNGGVLMSASTVTVTHSYAMNYVSVFAWLGVPSSYTLQGSAEFRNFYNN
jgi:Flp pilus assembly protein TadG